MPNLFEEFRTIVAALAEASVQSGLTARAWDSRVAAQWEQGIVTVVSRQGLIALERLRGSPQEVADIRSLEQIDDCR
jgi:hypothetical protein